MKQFVSLIFLFLTIFPALSQIQVDKSSLKAISLKQSIAASKKKAFAEQFALDNNLPIRFDTNGSIMEIQYVSELGYPQYYTTNNIESAKSIGTTHIKPGGSLGLDLDGSGMTLHLWDGGTIYHEHPELLGSAIPMDYSSYKGRHSTHVSGTIVGTGANNMAEGLAPKAMLRAYEWNNDVAEMAEEAIRGAIVSNHSYGFVRGWNQYGWAGNTDISVLEDYLFGFYDENSRNWDEIAFYAPGYLIVKSAGNDRNEHYTGGGDYPPDGPYDCLSQVSVAKNVLTVGAVEDLPFGYIGPSSVFMSSFSSWGPADDGRIKPDIVANGVDMISSLEINSSNEAFYASWSGTSMASPAVTGSCGLLQQHYQDLNGPGNLMRSATLKALVIHTADEAGSNSGPDYQFGWGLMNTANAALKISEDQVIDVISEQQLAQGVMVDRQVYVSGNHPLKVTLVWTDVPGTPVEAQLDPITPMLVNDLDLKIIKNTSTWFPWKLDLNNPTNAATNAEENDVDNVEVVIIDSPETGLYTIRVDHDGILQDGPQQFSLIISGISEDVAPVAQFRMMDYDGNSGENLQFRDESFGSPTAWTWSVVPDYVNFTSGTNANSQHPVIQFDEPMEYDITLTVNNAFGTHQVTRQISLEPSPCPYPTTFYGGSLTNNLPIISVVFNTINQQSEDVAGNYPYEDYSRFETHVFKGSVVPLKVESKVEFGSSITGHGFVWFDWNQDCDFDDSGEAFDLGTFVYSSNGEADEQTVNIQIPFSAITGKTRMRIAIRDAQDPLPDLQSVDLGEVEDYTIIIHSTDYPGFWTGLSSKEWERGSNWSGGEIPGPTVDVIIPTDVPRYPALTSSLDIGGSIASLELMSNASLYGDIHAAIEVNSTLKMNPGSFLSNPQSLRVYNGGTLWMNNATIKPVYYPTGSGNLFASIRFNEGSTVEISGGEITFGWGLRIDENVNFSYFGGLTPNFISSYLSDDYASNIDVRSNAIFFGDFEIAKGTNTSYVAESLIDFEVSSLTVNPDASFTLESGNDMLISSSLVLKDRPEGLTGSFINHGNVQIEDEEVYVYQHLRDDRWHFIASPVPNAQSNVFLGLYLKSWDETTYSWNYIVETDQSLVPGTGFITWSTLGDPTINYSSTEFNDQNVVPVLTSTDANGDLSIGDGEGWNLVGNPFTSALDWGTENDPVLGYNPQNLDETIYIWNGSQYASFNPAGDGLGTNDGSRNIPSLQSFFIKANDFNPQLNLPSGARVHSSSDNYKNSLSNEVLSLKVSNDKLSDETVIRFLNGSTENFDGKYDAYKLFGIEEAPQLYTMNNDLEYAINTMPAPTNNLVIPVCVYSGSSDSYQLKVNLPELISENWEIYLENTLEGSLQLLNDSFITTIDLEPGAEKHRFNLHFKSVNEVDKSEMQYAIQAYSYGSQLFMRSSTPEYVTLTLLNMLGQEVYKDQLMVDGMSMVDPSLQNGYYILSLQNNSFSIRKKIYLHQ